MSLQITKKPEPAVPQHLERPAPDRALQKGAVGQGNSQTTTACHHRTISQSKTLGPTELQNLHEAFGFATVPTEFLDARREGRRF